jgi:sulfite exporter TauE/SafE
MGYGLDEDRTGMDLAFLASLCSPAGVGAASGAALLAGLLLAGLTGSLMHCVPMCGPFVLGQAADRMARIPAAGLCEMQRVRGALLLPYHVGRITTYALLGAAAGGLGGSALPGRAVGPVLLLAACLFLAHGLRLVWPAAARVVPRADSAPAAWSRGVRAMAARFGAARRGTGWGDGLLLGLALGLLPCGMLYGALAVAAATGRAGGGALAMLAFGLGTVPALVAVGLAGHAAGRTWGSAMARLAPAAMLLNAVVLAALGWQKLALFG